MVAESLAKVLEPAMGFWQAGGEFATLENGADSVVKLQKLETK